MGAGESLLSPCSSQRDDVVDRTGSRIVCESANGAQQLLPVPVYKLLPPVWCGGDEDRGHSSVALRGAGLPETRLRRADVPRGVVVATHRCFTLARSHAEA